MRLRGHEELLHYRIMTTKYLLDILVLVPWKNSERCFMLWVYMVSRYSWHYRIMTTKYLFDVLMLVPWKISERCFMSWVYMNLRKPWHYRIMTTKYLFDILVLVPLKNYERCVILWVNIILRTLTLYSVGSLYICLIFLCWLLERTLKYALSKDLLRRHILWWFLNILSYFLKKKTYLVGNHKKRLSAALLMSTHNICFMGKFKKLTVPSWNTLPE